MDSLLEVENLEKAFPIRADVAVNAVNGISFSIARGEAFGLVGESGCGKTTTGRCIVRLIEPTRGNIRFEGINICKLNAETLRRTRSRLQIVFQEPYESLNPRKKVCQILEDPLAAAGRSERRKEADLIHRVLNLVSLDETRLERYPIQLTQGEQQRIGIARALITNPRLIVLDEPTSLLDIRFRAEIVILLRQLLQELGVSYLFITHDLVVISALCSRVAIMYLGRVVETGAVADVFEAPAHPYTKALLSSSLFPDPRQRRTDFILKGEVPSPINLPADRCNLAPRCPKVLAECQRALPLLQEVKPEHFCACFNPETGKRRQGEKRERKS
jgi:oligopeptide transport system ATP-binding protein